MKFARQEALKAWCQPTTKTIKIIPKLVEAFAEIIHELWSQPWLGNATTRELIDEIKTRIEMDGKLEYRTVDSEEA